MSLAIVYAFLSILSGLITPPMDGMQKTITIDPLRRVTATTTTYKDVPSGKMLFNLVVRSPQVGDMYTDSFPEGTKNWSSNDQAVSLKLNEVGVTVGKFDPLKAGEPQGNPITLVASSPHEGTVVGFNLTLIVHTDGGLLPQGHLDAWKPTPMYIYGDGSVKHIAVQGKTYKLTISTDRFTSSYGYIFTLSPE